MSKITLINSITRTGTYPKQVPIEAKSNCGTLQLFLNNEWTNQMIHELPSINITIYTPDNSKFLSFDIIMSTVNEELIKISPTEPYSIPIYNIPQDCKFSITPLFDNYALQSHNDEIIDGNIEIFNTSDKGIVDSNESSYLYELWNTATNYFDITIVFDNDNISSGGGGGGGTTPTDASDISYDNTTSGLSATNVQTAIDEIDNTIDNLPEPMIFKGSLGTGGTIETLPEATESNKGFTYKVITAGTYQGVTAKVGDTVISDGTSWILIPSGDEPSGTVTNVNITSTNGTINVTGSPITSSGTIDIDIANIQGLNSGKKALYELSFNQKGQITSAEEITSFLLNCESDGLDGTPETYFNTMKAFFDKNNANTLTPKQLTDLTTEWYLSTRENWNGWTTFENTGISTGTKGGDNEGLVCTPSTNTVKGTDDYAGLPLFYPIDVNYEIDADTKDILITAIDGITTGFERTNPDKFVGVMQQSGYVWTKKDIANNTFTNGYSSQPVDDADECWILPEAVRLDGTYRQFVVHTKYMGTLVNNKLKSYSGDIPTSYVISHDDLNIYGANNGSQYSGGSILLLSFLQIMTRIKYASLTQDGIIQGCVNYNYQYASQIAETDVKRVLITTAQAQNLIVGSSVLVGIVGSSNNVDRNTASVYSITGQKSAIITNIETVNVDGTDYAAIYVNTDNTFNTTGGGTLTTGNTIISTFTWANGSNDNILGNDGSLDSPGTGKYPAKIQGIEYSLGITETFGDIILASNPATTEYPLGYYSYYICKDASKRSTNITSDYIQLNTILPYVTNTTASWRYISEITFDRGISIPSNCSGGSSSTYTRDGFYFLATPNTQTKRQCRSFGDLNDGVGDGGLSSVDGNSALSGRDWNVGGRVSCVEAFRA